ncbi:latent-transforming growth factor beta-binding protein 2 [Odontomachus brunneus]|uniref:latent-transforming growth factor beta-binding protein 2 n=1 Tax=Odontomachus brunneus TaxID=486640 RepID=UPI0013F1A044|nr:latent-transforming growth factor beta-binding protein 2 [Odontomachus brunneus]
MMALKILLTCWFIANTACPALSSPEDHHRVPSRSDHRVVWPAWYRDRLLHARHDRSGDGRVAPETTTSRSPWTSRAQVTATRSPSPQQPDSWHHHMEQRTLEHNFSGAVAMTEHGGTRAIAYAGYHGNHRHQPAEVVTQSYQLIPTTAPTYTRHHPGRRVCTRQATSHHHRGRQIRLILGYTELTSGFICCPGWSQITHLSSGCNKPTCSAPCLNGGICTSPSKCTCPKGYTGNQCQTDIDECAIEKPCGQLCTNLPGSYRCHCRVGFQLQQDGQSCWRNDTDTENAFEARDLENDFQDDVSTTRGPTTSFHDTENEVGDDVHDYEIILKRLTKLEKQVARSRKRDTETSEMNTKVTLAVESVNEMRRTVENVQLMQQEVYDMRSKMKQYEAEMRKIQHLMNRVAELENRLRIRCRSTLPISGSLNF